MVDTLTFTDDWTGTNGAIWSNTKWGINVQSGSAPSIQTNRGRIVMPMTGNVRTIAWGYTSDSLYGDLTVTVNKGSAARPNLIYISPASTFTGTAGVAETHSGMTNGVYLVIPSDGAAASYLLAANAGTLTTGPSLTVFAAADYKVRIRRASNYLKVKIWLASNSEPATWDTTWTPAAGVFPTSPTDARPVIMIRTPTTATGTQTAEFDNLVFSIADDSQSASYTSNAMTASSTMPGGIPVFNSTYITTPATAGASAPEAVFREVLANKVADFDYGYDQDSNVYDGLITSQITGTGFGSGTAVLTYVAKFDVNTTQKVINSATLTLTTASNPGIGINATVYPIMNNFTNNSIRTDAGFTLGSPINVSIPATADTPVVADISNLLRQGRVYGFLIKGDNSQNYANIKTVEASPTGKPVIDVSTSQGSEAYYIASVGTVTSGAPNATAITSVNSVYTSSPITASALTPTPVVIPGVGLDYVASVATAGASSPDAASLIVNDMTPPAEAMLATATSPFANTVADRDNLFIAERVQADGVFAGGAFSLPLDTVAEAITAEAMSTDVIVTGDKGVNYLAPKISAVVRFTGVAAVNEVALETEDAFDNYFIRVTNLKPNKWARMTDVGRIITDRVSRQPLADVNNLVATGRNEGPQARASVAFNGVGSIVQREPSGTNQDEYISYPATMVDGDIPHSFEFSFRTDRANEFILGGSDGTISPTGVASPGNSFSEVVLINGRLGVNQYTLNYQGGTYNTNTAELGRGFRNLADNEWHHVVIRNYRSKINSEVGFEVWVDGALEFRRLVRGIITFAWPDYIGSRPVNPMGLYSPNGTLPALPDTQVFHGDFSEMVYYGFQLSKDDIERNRYAFMGWIPVEVPVSEATALSPRAVGKGNQKKALYLYWSGQDEVFGGLFERTGQKTEDNISFDPMPNLAADSYQAELTPRLSEETGEFFGFKVFTKSITKNYSPIGIIPYRDPVTDEQSTIDLTKDIDLADYDVIMFKDWPDEGYERDWYEANYPGQIERVLNQLRDANDAGMALYVTNPRLAIDLGIVDGIEFVKPLTESRVTRGQGRAAGLYDYGSAVKFPWDIVSSDGLTGNAFATGIGIEASQEPTFLAQKAHFYYDNNRNNKFRVVSKVPGLTDLPSYMLEDAVFHVDSDQFGWEGAAFKYLHREAGLEIGDEYIFSGASTVDPSYLDAVEKRYLRTNGTWATPLNNVKAGTVVTTFGSTLYNNEVKTNNPYQDYATTIVLEAGTELAGRPTGGRIFVNFTENPSQGLSVPVQVLPGSVDDVDNPLGLDPVSLSQDTVTFVSFGSALQVSLVTRALSRCTFPLGKLGPMIKSRYGRDYIPIRWESVSNYPKVPASSLAFADVTSGYIVMDEARCREVSFNDEDAEEIMIFVILHEIAHVVDRVYLQPYQRVNIWNAFHGPWNLFHPNVGDYILPPGTPLDVDSKTKYLGESWAAGSYQEPNEQLAEAFANAWAGAYSDANVPVEQFMPHPSTLQVLPLIRQAIEVGPGASLFQDSRVGSSWPAGYAIETNAQKEWEYSWTRTSLSFSASALKTRTVKATLPDGSVQSITQGTSAGTRNDLPLSMVRSGQLFPVIEKPRLEMTARGIYWLADAPTVESGDVIVGTTAMVTNVISPSATVTAQSSTGVLAQPATATAQSPESLQAKSGNALYLSSPMTAEATVSRGREKIIMATPMVADGEMVESIYQYQSSGERITLRVSRPRRITLKIKEAV